MTSRRARLSGASVSSAPCSLGSLARLPVPSSSCFIVPDKIWDRLRFRGVRLRDEVTKNTPQEMRERVWRMFKVICAEQGNWLPWVIYHIKPQFSGVFERRRSRRTKGSDPFDDLPPIQRARAQEIFKRLCNKWRLDLPHWRRAILVGVAPRLARHPSSCSSDWGRRMRRIKGGVHSRRRYQQEGWHPLPAVRKKRGVGAYPRPDGLTTERPDG